MYNNLVLNSNFILEKQAYINLFFRKKYIQLDIAYIYPKKKENKRLFLNLNK